MSKILFIHEHPWQHLGIMYLAAALKQSGHAVKVTVGPDHGHILRQVTAFAPDAVGFSIMTGGQAWALQLAGRIKARINVPIIFGGPHITYFPDFLEHPEVDVIIRGEGELAIVNLMNCIQNGRSFCDLPNVGVKTNGKPQVNDVAAFAEIDSFAFPDRSIYAAHARQIDMSVLNVLTSRGCPYQCSFCYEEQLRQLYRGKGRHVRVRSAESIVAEIRGALNSGISFRSVFFADDYFGNSVNWLYPFLELYRREINLPFTCLIRPEIAARHPDYSRRLAEAGCQNVAFGIETGNETKRNEILKKDLSNEVIIAAAEALHQAGLPFKTYNLFGFPGETPSNSFETVELNIRIAADYPLSNLFIPFPKTELTEYALQLGCIDRETIDRIGSDVLVHSYLKSPHAIFFERVHKLFQTAVLFPGLWPALKKLVQWRHVSRPIETLFNGWFGVVYFFVYWRSSGRRLPGLLAYAIRQMGSITKQLIF